MKYRYRAPKHVKRQKQQNHAEYTCLRQIKHKDLCTRSVLGAARYAHTPHESKECRKITRRTYACAGSSRRIWEKNLFLGATKFQTKQKPNNRNANSGSSQRKFHAHMYEWKSCNKTPQMQVLEQDTKYQIFHFVKKKKFASPILTEMQKRKLRHNCILSAASHCSQTSEMSIVCPPIRHRQRLADSRPCWWWDWSPHPLQPSLWNLPWSVWLTGSLVISLTASSTSFESLNSSLIVSSFSKSTVSHSCFLVFSRHIHSWQNKHPQTDTTTQ